MRRALALLVCSVCLAVPATASADPRICVAALGPDGDLVQFALTAKAPDCPAPGEAVPREWILGTPLPVGVAETGSDALPGMLGGLGVVLGTVVLLGARAARVLRGPLAQRV